MAMSLYRLAFHYRLNQNIGKFKFWFEGGQDTALKTENISLMVAAMDICLLKVVYMLLSGDVPI